MKIWHRYLFRKLALTFAVILLCLFFIYTMIDLSIHGVRFLTRGKDTNAFELLLYYIQQFAMHLDLFLPLAFLLSFYKVLLTLNSHLELVALQMAGLSRKKLLLPFFFFALLLSFLGYANHEYLAGEASAEAAAFKTAHSKSKKVHRPKRVQTLVLEDESELVFQQFDPQKKEFFDLFWIRSDKDIWHMKTLSFADYPPTGYFTDHLIREHHLFEKKKSFEEKIFPELLLDPTAAPTLFVPFERRSISALLLEASTPSKDHASLQTHLHRKLALPLLPLLALFTAAPFALSFSRHKRTFLIISLSLFAFLTYITLTDSLLILGENNVLHPAVAMWCCPVLLIALTMRRFAKL